VSGILIAAAFAAALLPLPSSAQLISPEQHRLTLIQALQQRLPGTNPADWVQGADTPSGKVQVIALNADNATNAADILAIGKKIWDKKFKDGKSLASCFPNAGKRVAASYPQFDTKKRQVVTVEMALNRCLALHFEPEIDLSNAEVMGPLSAYFKGLSDGQRMTVRAGNAQAREKFESGLALYQRRMGQKDFACASCHVLNAGGLHEGLGLSAAVGQAVTWPRLLPGGRVLGLQMQFQRCMQKSGAEPFALGTEEFNNLEYFLAFVSNGLTLRALAVQR
jgi:sulfur-oxidizing protein SoxA